jgi:hypothetical protein
VTGLIRSNDYCRRRPAGEAAAARTCTHACSRSGRRRVNRRFRNRACAICVAVKSNPIAFYRCVHCACIFDPHVGAKVAKKLEIGKFRFAIFQCLQASTSYFEVKVITHHHRYVISISTIREQSKLFYVYTRLFPPLRNSTIVHQTNCIQDSNTIRIDGS